MEYCPPIHFQTNKRFFWANFGFSLGIPHVVPVRGQQITYTYYGIDNTYVPLKGTVIQPREHSSSTRRLSWLFGWNTPRSTSDLYYCQWLSLATYFVHCWTCVFCFWCPENSSQSFPWVKEMEDCAGAKSIVTPGAEVDHLDWIIFEPNL